VVLPLFWDQHDNAQRVHETGFGVRLDTYGHEPEQLTGAIDRLLADERLRARLRDASERLATRPGTEQAADLIEGIATRSGFPGLRRP
jgi:UDP:flavonoid glycosyltransferase YjiC (YdhE family)